MRRGYWTRREIIITVYPNPRIKMCGCPELYRRVDACIYDWLTFDFLYVPGTHEVPTRLSVQSTEHSFHDKSLAPECIWGEWIYTGIIDPRIPSLPPFPLSRFDPFLAVVYTCVSFPSPLRPFSSPSLTPPLVAPYNDRPALSASASLYLPPSAAIAFTTISFYIVTFSACETIRVVRTLRPVLLSSKRRTGGEERVKKKESKNTLSTRKIARCVVVSRTRLHLYWRIIVRSRKTSGRHTIFTRGLASSRRDVWRL